MRWNRLFTAFMFLSLSAACALWGTSTTTRMPEPTALRWLEQVSRNTNTQARTELEQRFAAIEPRVQEIISRWKKKDLSYQSLLNGAKSPEIIWMDGKRIRASDFRYEEEMPVALELFANEKPATFELQTIGARSFLFYSGNFRESVFVAAFDLEEFFAGLNNSSTLQTWVATTSGKILFHPLSRFWNESIENLRPIANANAALADGQTLEPFEKFVGPDSQEVYGAWGMVPALKLVVATEWRGDLPLISTTNTLWVFVCGVLLALALACFISSFRPAESAPAGLMESATSASEFLNKQIELLRAEKTSSDQELGPLQLEARINQFWEKLLLADTPKQVWQLLLDFLIEQRLLVRSIVTYRFSQTSCSLIPESDRGLSAYDQVAQRFLRDSRIFLGSSKHLAAIEKTEAFKKWLLTRQKFLPVEEERLVFLPFQGGSAFRAALLLSLPVEILDSDPSLRILKSLVNRTACLYEQKQRLLELTDAKEKRRKPLEGSSDNSRGQSVSS